MTLSLSLSLFLSLSSSVSLPPAPCPCPLHLSLTFFSPLPFSTLFRDQNQLPPVISSPHALEHGLGVSLFSRLTAAGMAPSLLDEQYRMHPKIAEFSSNR